MTTDIKSKQAWKKRRSCASQCERKHLFSALATGGCFAVVFVWVAALVIIKVVAP